MSDNDDVTYVEWSKGVNEEIGMFTIKLENSHGLYTDRYSGGEEVEIQLDFSAGSTTVFKGYVENPNNVWSMAGNALELKGSHYTGKLLDITVTESYNATQSADTILKAIIDKYLTGYTYVNVEASTVNPVVSWNNKPFWDCVVELCAQASFDAFLDDDKDFHFFARNSKTLPATTERMVWDDNILSIKGLGIDTVDVKNKIIIYGQDSAGSPVIYTAEDSASQTTHGVKELIINDSSVNTYEYAQAIGDAKLADYKDTVTKGTTESLIAPGVIPGYKTWISHQIQDIHDYYRVVKFTHKLPDEHTIIEYSKVRNIPKIFNESKLKEQALEALQNPYQMEHSLNLTFDTLTDIDTAASSNVTISDGYLKLESGYSSGTMYSKKRNSSTNITAVHIKAVGEAIPGTQVYVSATNGTTDYEAVTLDTEKTLDYPGTELILKVVFNSASTMFDSITALYK